MFFSNFKYLIFAVIFILCILHKTIADIYCFKCYALQQTYKETDLHCSQFDASPKFQVHCPSSTLCMKRTMYYKTKTSVAKVVVRDCAPQKRTGQKYDENDNKWYKEEEVVQTAYEEGCFPGEIRGLEPPEYCFCGYHLCNNSYSIIAMNVYNVYAVAVGSIIINYYIRI